MIKKSKCLYCKVVSAIAIVVVAEVVEVVVDILIAVKRVPVN